MKKVIVILAIFLNYPTLTLADSEGDAKNMGRCFAHFSYVGILLAKSGGDNSKVSYYFEYAKKAERIGTELSQVEFKKMSISEMSNLKKFDVEKYVSNDAVKRLLASCAYLINEYPSK